MYRLTPANAKVLSIADGTIEAIDFHSAAPKLVVFAPTIRRRYFSYRPLQQ
jgi:hypothetical protein